MTDTWTLLQQRLRRQPGAPLVTWVDASRGDRVELSAASLGNAAVKIANALRGELDLEPGAVVAVDLPNHWQRSAWCAGAWIAGCAIDTRPTPTPGGDALIVTSSERAPAHGAPGCPLGVVSLHPLGLPDGLPLPAGAVDLTQLVRQQPDQYLFQPAAGSTPAYLSDGASLTQDQVFEVAHSLAANWDLAPGGRLLAPDTTGRDHLWAAALAVPLACEASVVLASGHGDLDLLARQEAVTARAY